MHKLRSIADVMKEVQKLEYHHGLCHEAMTKGKVDGFNEALLPQHIEGGIQPCCALGLACNFALLICEVLQARRREDEDRNLCVSTSFTYTVCL